MNSSDPSAPLVLMICYYYPPIRTSGTTRSLEFSRRLPAFGWKPIVLTVRETKDPWVELGEPVPDSIEIVRTREWNFAGIVYFLHGIASRFLRIFGCKLARNYFHECFCIPDMQIAWLSTPKGVKLAGRARCIYASCSPFSSALSACLIKVITGKPCVLDFRDAWSFNPYPRPMGLRRFIQKRLERMVIAKADKVILNTKGTERIYRDLYPHQGGKFVCIPNGFDRLNPVGPEEKNRGKYRIVHVGVFYTSRTPDLLLQALKEIGDPEITFVQVGPTFESYEHFARDVPIEIVSTVEREEALRLMRGASLLYLRQGREKGVTNYIAVAAKTFEYLATGLPILAECPPGDNVEVLREYGLASYIVTDDSCEEMKKAVIRAKAEWPGILPKVSSRFIEDYDRNSLTRRLAEVFDEVSGIGKRDVD